MRLSIAFALLVALLAAGCASPIETRLDEETSHPDAPPIAPFTECTVVTYRQPAASRDHVDPCSDVDYPSHPPAGGAHYGLWADFRAYDAPVPWGFLVHSLEHGAVVMAHRCDEGCPEVLAGFDDVAASIDDPVCRAEDGPRVIVTPDPTLEWPIAVVAWEHVYLATCLDRPSLEAFVDAHYGRAPEDLCAPGLADPAC